MSIEISSINIKASTTGAKQSADDLNKIYLEAGKLERRVETLTEKLAKLSNAFSAGTGSAKAYADAIALQQRALVGSNSGISLLASSMATLAANIATMSTSMQQNTVQVNVNRQAILTHNAAMADAQAASRGLAGSLGMLWTTYGNTAPLAAGLAIGASMKQIVTIGLEVENTLEALRLKGGETVEAANQMRIAIGDISQGVYGPVEVTKAFETLILAGLKATEATAAVGAALNLATAGGSTIENAAQSLVTIGTAIGATANQFDYVADGITKAANISLASVDSIAEAMKRASVVNKLYGASFEDILTQTAALAQLGIKNTAAGTAITNFYANAMGGSQKAKKALDELGFSFTDATGKAKPLVEAFEGFDAALNKFDLKSQKNLIMDIFGERALRDVEALRSQVNEAANDQGKYANKLRETRGEIERSAGESALVSAQMALTTENQFKAVGNTLKSSFGGAFSAIEPLLYSIADTMQKAFASEGFKNGIANMAYALTSLAKAFVDNLDTVKAFTEALLVVGAITAGGGIFRSMIPIVNGLAVAFGATAVAANGAAVATGLFGTAVKLLPGIGMVLGVIASAWALIELNTKKAVTATEDMNRIKSGGFLDNLKAEAERIEKVNEQLAKGVDLTKAQTIATAAMAMQEGRKGFVGDEAAAQAAVTAAEKAVNAKRIQDLTFNQAASKEGAALLEAQKKLNAAKQATAGFDKEALDYTTRITKATQQQSEQLKIMQTTKDTIEAGQAGNQSYSGKKESKGDKSGVDAVQAEIDANKKWIAGHTARLELINQMIESETKLQGTVYTSEAKAFLQSEAATKAFAKMGAAQAEKARNELLATAASKDSLKFEEDKAKAVGEFTSKLVKAESAQNAYNTAEGKRDGLMGQYERDAVALSKLVGMTDADSAAIIKRAAAIDVEAKAQDNRKKAMQYAASSEVRAGTSENEYENLMQYGIAVKQTASQLAELEIKKLNLNEITDASIINDIRESASKETLYNAMKEVAKMYVEMTDIDKEREAYGAEGVIGAETAKVQALQTANEKKLELYSADARAQIAIQQASGQITAEVAASRLSALDAAMAKLKGNFAQSFKVAELKDVSTIFSNIATSVEGLGKNFTKAATALQGFSGAFKNLAAAQEKERVGDKSAAADKIGAYGDMASAASEFFDKQSTGYKVMQGVSQAYHAVQLAMNLKSMISGVAAGAAQMFAQSGWGGFAGVAAMGAVMAGLGFAISGGGGSGGQTAAEVQKTQGSGTVFGDSSKQSESISNSLKKLSENSNAMLPLTNAMVNSLRNIETAMVGLGNLIIRSGGVADGSNLGISTGTMSIGNSITSAVTKLTTLGVGGWTTGISEKLASLWGKTKQDIVDAGISFKGTVADLQKGLGYSQYASVNTTKSSFFGLKKSTSNSVQTSGLDGQLSSQFATIFTNLEDTLKIAAVGLGASASSVGDAIDKMVLDSKVSLKGLTGQALTDALNNVISGAMDDISKAAIPGMEKFQQVGEGYAETVIRVASNYERLNVVMSAVGLQFNSFGMASLQLREDFIKMAGGIDKLESKVKGYYDSIYTDAEKQALAQKQLSGAMSALGYSTITTKEQFKKLVEGLDITNSTQQALFNSLMDLAPVFGTVADASKEAADASKEAADKIAQSEKDLLSNRLAMQLTIANLENNTSDATAIIAQQRIIELAAVDASLRPLQERINMLNDEKALIDKLKGNANSAFSVLQKSVAAEKNSVDAAYKAQSESLKASLKTAQADVTSLTKVFDSLSSALKTTLDNTYELTQATRDAATASLRAALASGKSLASADFSSQLETLNKPSEQLYSTREDYMREQGKQAILLKSLQDVAGDQKSAAEQAVDSLNTQIEMLDKQHIENIARLDAILTSAQLQLDAMNGVQVGVTSLAAAMAGFSAAISAVNSAKAAQVNATPLDGISQLYKDLLGRSPDASGYAFWKKAEGNGASLSSIAQQFVESQEYKSLHPSLAVGTNFLPKDMTINAHAGERIIPAADNLKLQRAVEQSSEQSGDNKTAEALATLQSVIMQGDVANVQMSREMFKLLRKWDQDGQPETRNDDAINS